MHPSRDAAAPSPDARAPDFADVMVDVILGYECNVKCDYCSVEDAMRPHNMTTAEVLRELAHARSLGIRKAAFGGGEPTIRRDLLPIVRFGRDRGFESVKVSSNGLMYSYEAYAREAVEAGVTQFNVSVMAHTDALYERILGRRGALAAIEKGVRNLVRLGRPPVADLIVKDDTWRHLADVVEFWAARGIRTFPLWLVALVDRNRNNFASLPRVSEMRDGIVAAFEAGRRLGVDVYSRHVPRCMLPGREEHVRDLREDRVMVVTPGSRFYLWESAISPTAYSPKCERCRYVRGACLGVRRDYLERWGDDEVVPYEGENPAT
ncbi:MAG: radical SAM protein [Deltaproteobacteria bacterium]|nr:radical SAM protein [Deltaproteobacteria bacterium]